MTPDKDREYSELISFVSIFASHILKIDTADPVHPANVASHTAASMGKAKAFIGAKQAANDAIEMLQGLTQQQIVALDAKLRAVGVVTLANMFRRYSKQYRGILKRGRLRDETEFYLVNGILDSCTESLGQNEQATLISLLLAFEQSS